MPDHYSKNINEFEKKLIGDWRYEYIEVNGIRMEFADENLNASNSKSAIYGGERSVLSRRWINYSVERNYQLRWNRSTYQLGTDGDPNWQPNFGAWELNETGDKLIHNKGQAYSVTYTLSFSNNRGYEQLIRISERYMSLNSLSPQNAWKAGDVVTFMEVFRRK